LRSRGFLIGLAARVADRLPALALRQVQSDAQHVENVVFERDLTQHANPVQPRLAHCCLSVVRHERSSPVAAFDSASGSSRSRPAPMASKRLKRRGFFR
jgi:hypothetical protein